MHAGVDMYDDDGIFRASSSASRRRPYGPGPDRRVAFRHLTRTTPYSVPPQPQVERRRVVPEMDLEDDKVSENKGTKLYISNLDYGVSNADIKLLFSEEGELKRYGIHYDKSGRSKGTAEVVFMRQSDALAAIKKYNNMRLDGKPLQIELVGSSLVTPAPAVVPLSQNSLQGRLNHALVREQGIVGGSRFNNSFPRGYLPRDHGEENHFRKVTSYRDLDHDLEGFHRRRPRGRTGFKGHKPKLSVKDLDEDLERYRLEAKKVKKEKGE
ncbi:THO complex subunit 4A-like [Lotus japonicus]|uniref:THO complex subunit 4A-like n=1 Tax=Lotus japonicus TaxID=34305 RepID=UPI00258F5E99|nr:THO complex subunit 4A-like [Lotus japonicus]